MNPRIISHITFEQFSRILSNSRREQNISDNYPSLLGLILAHPETDLGHEIMHQLEKYQRTSIGHAELITIGYNKGYFPDQRTVAISMVDGQLWHWSEETYDYAREILRIYLEKEITRPSLILFSCPVDKLSKECWLDLDGILAIDLDRLTGDPDGIRFDKIYDNLIELIEDEWVESCKLVMAHYDSTKARDIVSYIANQLVPEHLRQEAISPAR